MSQTSPLTPLIKKKPWNALQRGFVTPRRSAGDFLWRTHIFPNRPTFGLEITGQTNEFNELWRTQWMPLAIWTQIKGYGQVSRPFQGGLYTNVTESGRFSVCADKLFKVPRMSVVVPPSAPPPFCSPFLCLLLFQEESHKYKSGECGALFCDVTFASFLSAANAQSRGPAAEPERHHCRENKAQMRPGTSSDGDSLLLPPFHHFAFLILPSFPPLVYTAALADAPSSASSRFESAGGFTRWMVPKPKRWRRRYRGNGCIWQRRVCVMKQPGCRANGWGGKKTPQSIWLVCVHLIESIGGPWETTKGGKS